MKYLIQILFLCLIVSCLYAQEDSEHSEPSEPSEDYPTNSEDPKEKFDDCSKYNFFQHLQCEGLCAQKKDGGIQNCSSKCNQTYKQFLCGCMHEYDLFTKGSRSEQCNYIGIDFSFPSWQDVIEGENN